MCFHNDAEETKKESVEIRGFVPAPLIFVLDF